MVCSKTTTSSLKQRQRRNFWTTLLTKWWPGKLSQSQTDLLVFSLCPGRNFLVYIYSGWLKPNWGILPIISCHKELHVKFLRPANYRFSKSSFQKKTQRCFHEALFHIKIQANKIWTHRKKNNQTLNVFVWCPFMGRAPGSWCGGSHLAVQGCPALSWGPPPSCDPGTGVPKNGWMPHFVLRTPPPHGCSPYSRTLHCSCPCFWFFEFKDAKTPKGQRQNWGNMIRTVISRVSACLAAPLIEVYTPA